MFLCLLKSRLVFFRCFHNKLLPKKVAGELMTLNTSAASLTVRHLPRPRLFGFTMICCIDFIIALSRLTDAASSEKEKFFLPALWQWQNAARTHKAGAFSLKRRWAGSRPSRVRRFYDADWCFIA
jgi:hypothetical protein